MDKFTIVIPVYNEAKNLKKKIFITSLEKIKEIYQNHVFWVLKNQSTTI